MSVPKKLTPFDFAHQDSLSDPQISADGSHVTFIRKADGKPSVIWLDLDNGSRKAVAEAVVRSAHPFGGGVTQLSRDGKTLYFVTSAGGIASVERDSGKIVTVYEGPGVTQISLSGNSERIAAVVFGDRVAIFDASGRMDPVTVSERHRRLASFDGLPAPNNYLEGEPDFIFDVTLSYGGDQIAWHEWSLPYMAWQRSQIAYLNLEADGDEGQEIVVCAGGDSFVAQPRFSPDGRSLGFLTEVGGYLRLWLADLSGWSARLVVDEKLEHGGAPWGNGNRTFDFSPDGRRIYFSRNEAGHGRLVRADMETSEVSDLAKAHHFGLKASKGSVVAVRSGARTPNTVVRYDLETGNRIELERAYSEAFYSRDLVEPEIGVAPYSTSMHHFLKPSYRKVIANLEPLDVPFRLFRPEAAVGPIPTVATFHGGPTDQALVTYSARNLAFLQAGYQVLSFDYRGSTGWGRLHREALDSNFGLGEVVDLLSVVAELTSEGLVEPGSVVVNGGSSGGYSALRSICMTAGLFCAGIASYPLIDLADTVVSTHRLESRYFDTLVGRIPDEIRLYQSRSVEPSELDEVPLLIMHGDCDPVVNHRQVVRFVDEAKRLGKEVEFMLFPGEGHGFSAPETLEAEYAAYERFLGTLIGALGPHSS